MFIITVSFLFVSINVITSCLDSPPMLTVGFVYMIFTAKILMVNYVLKLNAKLITERVKCAHKRLECLEYIRSKHEILHINRVVEVLVNLTLVVELFNEIFGRQLFLIIVLCLLNIIATIDFFLELDYLLEIHTNKVMTTVFQGLFWIVMLKNFFFILIYK